MWSHYANDHSGICLGFHWLDDEPFFGRAQEVHYEKDRPTVVVPASPTDIDIDGIFLTKFIDWEYESEWRIIDHDNGEGVQNYSAHLLRSITFGLRTKIWERACVTEWLKARGTEVQLRECWQDPKSFKIHIRPAGAA